MTEVANDALDRLAAHYGIEHSYLDFGGKQQLTRPQSKRALLAAMGISAANELELIQSLADLGAENARRRVAPEMIVRPKTPVSISTTGAFCWNATPIDMPGEVIHGRGRGEMLFPPMEMGVYVVEVEWSDDHLEDFTLIVAPARAPSISDLTSNSKLWGVNAALYGLRSKQDQGIGDYADLGAAAALFARKGASFLGINPVHALGHDEEAMISPYSPSSRRFYNPTHLCLDTAAAFAGVDSSWQSAQDTSGGYSAGEPSSLINYQAVRTQRAHGLSTLFQIFCANPSSMAFVDFLKFKENRGEDLRLFATHQAISERFGSDWRIWPDELRLATGRGVTQFAALHSDRIDYYCWQQWHVDSQLGCAQASALQAGMSLGLYLDIAVGVRPGGADAWAWRDAMANGVSIGAPGDAFNADGQNWGLTTFSPDGLRRTRYRPFIEMLKATMRHAGMVRIDHVLGLFRSFWIPESGEPGAYVRYPLKSMLAIVAIEAWRNKTIVVGEDLGLVSQAFRREITDAGLYGCAVMQFERDDEGRFLSPDSYSPTSLASFGTHDTPTYAGFNDARDVQLWSQINPAGQEKPADVRVERAKALRQLVEPSTGEVSPGKGKDESPASVLPASAMHRSLASSSSALVMVQLDDVLDVAEQQNLPGTIDEHPNWRRRYKESVESLAHDQRLTDVSRIMLEAGRSRVDAS